MPQTVPKNLVLSSLASADFGLLEPHLEPVDLPLRKVLERRGRPIKTVYFPNAGFASVVADGGSMPIEVGLIGREGTTGIPILLGADRSEHDTFMQAAGEGYCIRTSSLREAIDKSRTLHRVLLLAANGFVNQATRTAVANGRAKIDERLARWLLMAHDRIDGNELPLTHDFLAMMLAVRRPGVTMAINDLEKAGLIAAKRGRITIVNREGLEKRSNGHYAQADYS